MSFFSVNKNVNQVVDSGALGEYITTSGIYDVTIDFASVKVNAFNARSIDFNCKYKGSGVTFYGLKLDNNDGSENYQRAVFNHLCIIAGIDNVSEPVTITVPLGKEGKLTDLAVLEDFSGLEVKVWVKYIYSKYNGEIKQKAEIVEFFRASDNASAKEILTGENIGSHYAKSLSKANDITYKDGLTQEDVIAWKKSRANSLSVANIASAKPVQSNPFAI